MKVLIVEDNALLRNSLKWGMEELGWTVDLAPDGEEGLFCASASEHDVIVLDRMLPKISGTEILHELRKTGRKVPIIMMTAECTVADRVQGLEQGADDYIVKPFEFVELAARINALFRRSIGNASPVLKIGNLSFNLSSHTVALNGEVIELTGKEYDLLAALATKNGMLVSRDELLGSLYQLDAEPFSNSLDVLLTRVRKKLQGSGVEIATVRGKGLVLRAADAVT